MTQNKTIEYYKKICNLVYIGGWPKFWVADINVPTFFTKYHGVLSKTLNLATLLFIIMELSSVFTQKNLTEKQKSDRLIFNISHPILCSFGFILMHYEDTFKAILKALAIELKEDYNNVEIERDAIKKSWFYSAALVGTCVFAISAHGVAGLQQCIYTDATFVTVITVWPDVEDRSLLAGTVRVINFVLWWIVISRAFFIYVIVISTIIFLGQQFKQLQRYFYSLIDIFENNHPQSEMEEIYEKAFNVGIKMHSRTLWCARQYQSICIAMFSGIIFINITIIVLLMSQMLDSERTIANLVATATTMISVLIGTGFIMWNAGDMTVEASQISTAMFHSGWQNCQTESSVRIRKLLVISMTQAQKPVNMTAMGIIDLSYDSYVSICKSSYSVFSVLY